MKLKNFEELEDFSDFWRDLEVLKTIWKPDEDWSITKIVWSRIGTSEIPKLDMGNSPGKNVTEPAVADALTSVDQKSSRSKILEDEGGLDSSLIKDVGKYTWYTFK